MDKILVKPFDSIGIPYELFLKWCEENDKNPNTIKTKKEFFRLILDGKLSKEGNQLIKKRAKRNE